jgi:hypothetical protein
MVAPYHRTQRINTMKRFFPYLFTALAFGAMAAVTFTVQAADLKGPPEKIDASGNVKPAFTGCYGGASGSTSFVKAKSDASEIFQRLGVGAGCDYQFGRYFTGASLAYDFGYAPMAAVAGRVGYTINPYTAIYGLASLQMDGTAPKMKDGMLSAGVGLEVFAAKNLTLFVEATRDVKTFGIARELSESTSVRVGGRYRFGGSAW